MALILLLQWLRQERIVATAVLPLDTELDEFERHLTGVCGLAASSRYRYLRVIRHFLRACFGGQPIDVARVTVHDVRGFIEQHCEHWRPASLRLLVAAVRSYLRYKALGGAVHTREPDKIYRATM